MRMPGGEKEYMRDVTQEVAQGTRPQLGESKKGAIDKKRGGS